MHLTLTYLMSCSSRCPNALFNHCLLICPRNLKKKTIFFTTKFEMKNFNQKKNTIFRWTVIVAPRVCCVQLIYFNWNSNQVEDLRSFAVELLIDVHLERYTQREQRSYHRYCLFFYQHKNCSFRYCSTVV